MVKLLYAVLLALPLPCHAEVNKWVSDGNVAPVQAVADPAAPSRRVPQEKPQAGGKARTAKQAKVETDASRCDMARDIKNDKLALSNGMPIDANDLQTAENDIRRFCR